MASVEADFDHKTATVTMKPGAALTSDQVAHAFAGSKYSQSGPLETIDAAGAGR